MDNLLYLRLEAHNPARNHHRRYEVRLGRDLFGRWVVTLGFGRAGFGGRQVCFSDEDPAVIRNFIRECLGRRATAPKRLGCVYRLREMSTGDGVGADYWVPAAVLYEFVSETHPLVPSWGVRADAECAVA